VCSVGNVDPVAIGKIKGGLDLGKFVSVLGFQVALNIRHKFLQACCQVGLASCRLTADHLGLQKELAGLKQCCRT